MSERLERRQRQLADAGRKALVTFITAGDPDAAATVPALHAMVAAGADILEVGVPFSDPEAEGPAIQAASERALAAGTTLRGVLQLVSEFRRTDPETPIVLMGYLNSVLAMGEGPFAAAAQDAGVDALILVNLPPEEAPELRAQLTPRGIDLVCLVAPTTTPARRRSILESCQGFVYYVSLKGITGANHIVPTDVAANVEELKGMTALPVYVGFGIKDATSASAVAASADGVVVGSALVSIMAAAAGAAAREQQLAALVADIRAALDNMTADIT